MILLEVGLAVLLLLKNFRIGQHKGCGCVNAIAVINAKDQQTIYEIKVRQIAVAFIGKKHLKEFQNEIIRMVEVTKDYIAYGTICMNDAGIKSIPRIKITGEEIFQFAKSGQGDAAINGSENGQ